jgi:hypothetical protein
MLPNVRLQGRLAALTGVALLALGLAAGGAAPALAVNGGACARPYPLIVDPANFTDANGAAERHR